MRIGAVLICLKALNQARRDLERARRGYAAAALALNTAHERLVHAITHAAGPSVSPCDALECEQAAAEAVNERAIAGLTEAEERWFALRAALAEEEMMAVMGPPSRHRLN